MHARASVDLGEDDRADLGRAAGTLLRRGGLSAWWNGGEPAPRRGLLVVEPHIAVPRSVPVTRGRVTGVERLPHGVLVAFDVLP